MFKKTILSKLLTCFLSFVLVILLINLVILPLVFNIRSYSVLTGSMSPDIKVASLVYVKKLDSKNLYDNIQVGDDITYKTDSGIVVTHRITSINKEENKIITKGIRTDSSYDAPISSKNVIGKVLFSIPLLGIFGLLFQNKLVLIMFILFILLVICVLLLISELKKKPKSI